MRLAPGIVTFMVGLLILAIAGIFYQQSLIASGSFGTGSAAASAAPTKYICPMRCVEADEPGNCPVCGMNLTAVETAAPVVAEGPPLYTCPMHSQIEQDRPGTCPICGMELVPKRTDVSDIDPETGKAVAAVKLSPLQAVLSDVTIVHAVLETVGLTIPGFGEVGIPEDQVNMLVSWQGGRVDNLLVRETGGEIYKGQHLLDIYSEELVQAQDEYLLALEAVEKLKGSRYESVTSSSKRMLEASRKKLLRLGMNETQLVDLEASGNVQDHLPIYATHGGIVMQKAITEGMYVKEGSMLFSVANLDPVWVEVEIFEQDMQNLKVGDKVILDCPIHPDMEFDGKIILIEPTIDPKTRTHHARVVVDNPDFILRPKMIMSAEITVDYGEMLLLPRHSVLHTGDGDLVYVLIGENLWEPRRVEVGRDFGDRVEILSGISLDDAVAGTAVFLLDSEAQLKGIPRPTSIPEPELTEGGNAGHSH